MARYERFAGALTGAGYLVYALDLRGHGKSIPVAMRRVILVRRRGPGWSMM